MLQRRSDTPAAIGGATSSIAWIPRKLSLSYGQNVAHPEQAPLQLPIDLTFAQLANDIEGEGGLRTAFHRFCSDLKLVRWGLLAGHLYLEMQFNPLEEHIYFIFKSHS
jgi:hypothetical protein